MKLVILLFLVMAKSFAFECRVDIVNPKTKKIQKVPFEIGKKKDFGFKTSEYRCSVTTETIPNKDFKKLNLTCVIPGTKIIAMTSGLLGIKYPSAPNLFLRDRNGNDRNLILVCLK